MRYDILSKTLNLLHRAGIDMLGKTTTKLSFSSIDTQIIDGVQYNRVNFNDTVDLYENQLFYIESGRSKGYHFVKQANGDSILIETGYPQDRAGSLIVYNSEVDLLETFYNNAIDQLEVMTNQSFRGVKEFTEYLSGSGTYTCLLTRKKIRSLISVNFVTPLYHTLINQPLTISLADLDEDAYLNKGMLQFKPRTRTIIFNNTYYFHTGKNNIQVRGTYGYEESEYPSDIIQAISLWIGANILLQESLENGGLSNFSIDAYSESYANPMGRFGGLILSYKNQARTLLAKYTTGIH